MTLCRVSVAGVWGGRCGPSPCPHHPLPAALTSTTTSPPPPLPHLHTHTRCFSREAPSHSGWDQIRFRHCCLGWNNGKIIYTCLLLYF